MVPKTLIMFLSLFLLGNVISQQGKEFSDLIQDGELTVSRNKYVKYIVPGSAPNFQKHNMNLNIQHLISEDNEYYQQLKTHIELGHMMKGLTFNLYDDNMRESAISLFRLLKSVKEDNLLSIKEWAIKNINKDIVEYAFRLLPLYREIELQQNEPKIKPPFVVKPNYFVNSETVNKALKLKINNGKFDEREGYVNQYYREDNTVIINSNYSNWNFWNGECEYRLDYFREDIGLNSYYYGIHLLYPFWMSNDELSETDPQYANQYYYIHKQLSARYNLEKEHLKYFNKTALENCYENFNPSLVYDNGLSFPIRSNTFGANVQQSRIKAIDIAIKECISRGFIYMDNGTKVTLTETNYVDLLTKLIRANFEGPQISKVVKSLYGYGGSGYSVDKYNPAPSVLHHPETSLRDPIHWYLIENLLKYFTDYAMNLVPYDFSKYESNEFEIIDAESSKITTYYDYFKFSLNNFFADDEHISKSLTFAVRQKRLKHLPFVLNFTINSTVNKTGTVKLFLGPQCYSFKCWDQYSKFFEMDSFPFTFFEGINYVSWTSDTSLKFSFDDYYNINSRSSKANKYDMFKFPENMLIPKGLDVGLNLTLFIMINSRDQISDINYEEPLGFPFHRKASVLENALSGNHKFFNVTIFHKEGRKDSNGIFSPHLS